MDPYERAEAFIAAVADRSLAVGNLRCLAVCHYAHGAMASAHGDAEGAARSLDAAVELNERIGSPAGVAYAMATMADLRTLAGDLDGGWEAVLRGLEASERASIRDHCLMSNQAAGIRNRIAAGDLERAASLVREAVAADEVAGPSRPPAICSRPETPPRPSTRTSRPSSGTRKPPPSSSAPRPPKKRRGSSGPSPGSAPGTSTGWWGT